MDIRPVDANALADDFIQDSKDAGFYTSIYVGAARRVQAAPTLDYAPVRHGEWEFDVFTAKYGNPYRCSICKEEFDDTHNYCPNCGAKMNEEKEE